MPNDHGLYASQLTAKLLTDMNIKPVIQEEETGCAIAACAALAGMSYVEARRVANRLGIYAADKALWSETHYIRKLLRELGISASTKEVPFESWESMPEKALLAIKWREENGLPYWHWVVFLRDKEQCIVLDSKKGLKSNIRRDFGRMKPRWYIEIYD